MDTAMSVSEAAGTSTRLAAATAEDSASAGGSRARQVGGSTSTGISMDAAATAAASAGAAVGVPAMAPAVPSPLASVAWPVGPVAPAREIPPAPWPTSIASAPALAATAWPAARAPAIVSAWPVAPASAPAPPPFEWPAPQRAAPAPELPSVAATSVSVPMPPAVPTLPRLGSLQVPMVAAPPAASLLTSQSLYATASGVAGFGAMSPSSWAFSPTAPVGNVFAGPFAANVCGTTTLGAPSTLSNAVASGGPASWPFPGPAAPSANPFVGFMAGSAVSTTPVSAAVPTAASGVPAPWPFPALAAPSANHFVGLMAGTAVPPASVSAAAPRHSWSTFPRTSAKARAASTEPDRAATTVVGALPPLIMAPFLHQIVDAAYPGYRCSAMGMRVLESIVLTVCDRVLHTSRTWQRGPRAPTSSRAIQSAVRLELPDELAKHAVSEGTKAVVILLCSGAAWDERAASNGYVPLPLIARYARSKGSVLTPSAAAYCAAATEYFARELIDLSAQAANRRMEGHLPVLRLITPDDIAVACHGDPELAEVVFRDAAVLPWLSPATQRLLYTGGTDADDEPAVGDQAAARTQGDDDFVDASDDDEDEDGNDNYETSGSYGEVDVFAPCYVTGDELVRRLDGYAQESTWKQQVKGTSCVISDAVSRVLLGLPDAGATSTEEPVTVLIADDQALENPVGALGYVMLAREVVGDEVVVPNVSAEPSFMSVRGLHQSLAVDDEGELLTQEVCADLICGRNSTALEALQPQLHEIVTESSVCNLSSPPSLGFATQQLLDWPAAVLRSLRAALQAWPTGSGQDEEGGWRPQYIAVVEELERAVESFRPRAETALRSLIGGGAQHPASSWECVHMPLLEPFSPVWEAVVARIETRLLDIATGSAEQDDEPLTDEQGTDTSADGQGLDASADDQRPHADAEEPKTESSGEEESDSWPDDIASDSPLYLGLDSLVLDPVAFEKTVRAIAHELTSQAHFTPGALFALQTAAEDMLMEQFAQGALRGDAMDEDG